MYDASSLEIMNYENPISPGVIVQYPRHSRMVTQLISGNWCFVESLKLIYHGKYNKIINYLPSDLVNLSGHSM